MRNSTKWIALLLCLAMCLSCLPASVFAEQTSMIVIPAYEDKPQERSAGTGASVTLTVTVPERDPSEQPALAIVTEPMSFTGSVGKTAKFAVEANRTDVTYRWHYSNNGGKSWSKSTMTGADTAELSVEMKAFRDGQMYKCVVTDSTGASVTSAAVKMSIPAAGLRIVENPADVQVAVNQNAVFTVKAEGEGLTYQWMYSNNEGKSWSKSSLSGFDTASVTVAGKAFRSGQQYKCIVTDASGNIAESTPATMTVA